MIKVALLASIPHSALAVGTGFTQLFRGIGQVSGVAVASAVFQSILTRELRTRFTGPGSDEVSNNALTSLYLCLITSATQLIRTIRHSFKIVETLPIEQQVAARTAYANSLRIVFYFSAAATLAGFLIRLPVCVPLPDQKSR